MTVPYACPRCRAVLHDWACAACAATYAMRDGIPDFRVPDLAAARFPAAQSRSREVAAYLRRWRARRTADDRRLGEELLEQFLRFSGLSRAEGELLDIGCRDGALAAYLPASVAYHGIDPEIMAAGDAAKRRLAFATAEFLPYPDGAFDHAASIASIDYFLDAAAALAECRRVLKPGGILLVQVGVQAFAIDAVRGRPLAALAATGAALARGRVGPRAAWRHWRLTRAAERRHQTYFTLPGLLTAVTDAGFAVLEAKEVRYQGNGVALLRAERGR